MKITTIFKRPLDGEKKVSDQSMVIDELVETKPLPDQLMEPPKVSLEESEIIMTSAEREKIRRVLAGKITTFQDLYGSLSNRYERTEEDSNRPPRLSDPPHSVPTDSTLMYSETLSSPTIRTPDDGSVMRKPHNPKRFRIDTSQIESGILSDGEIDRNLGYPESYSAGGGVVLQPTTMKEFASRKINLDILKANDSRPGPLLRNSVDRYFVNMEYGKKVLLLEVVFCVKDLENSDEAKEEVKKQINTRVGAEKLLKFLEANKYHRGDKSMDNELSIFRDPIFSKGDKVGGFVKETPPTIALDSNGEIVYPLEHEWFSDTGFDRPLTLSTVEDTNEEEVLELEEDNPDEVATEYPKYLDFWSEIK